MGVPTTVLCSYSMMLDLECPHSGVRSSRDYSILVQIRYACNAARVYILDGYVASGFDRVPDIHIATAS